MKKIIALLSLIALVFSLAACELPLDFLNPEIPEGSGSDLPENPENPETPEDPEEPEEPAGPVCEHEFVEIGRTEAKPLSDGVIISKCGLCDEEKTDIHTPMTKKLKVLAIGNSHSENAVADLWDVCASAGLTNLVIGNAVIGGSGLSDHVTSILYNNSVYTYKKYTGDASKNVSEGNVKIDKVFNDEKWDVVVIQQRSQYVQDSTFVYLDKLIETINKKCPNAEIYWHITWSFENIENFSSASMKDTFIKNFEGDSMVMYEAMIDAVEKHIIPNENIKTIISAGTAIQNLRSSYVGDTLTRDGVHVKPGMARYTVALTWYAFLTGGSLDLVKWYPSNLEQMEEVLSNYNVIAESVENALKNPYDITQSQYVSDPFK